MAKPATRLPKATMKTPPLPQVTPAPDNGVPFTQQSARSPAPIKRRGKQIAVRIPEELYDRLQACMDGTLIPQGRLVARALDAELKSHGY
jgi:hypothetical protein